MNPASETVLRACELLRAFVRTDEILRVQDLADRARLHKATASRLLLTLESAGFVERVPKLGYRSLIRFVSAQRVRIGYASQTEASLFAHEVSESVKRAAQTAGVDLIFHDNQYDRRLTERNARQMIEERVDVAIDFQTFEALSQQIASQFQAARIPLISVDLPAPGAIYFGADNYRAGRIAGRALGRWTRQNWKRDFEHVLLIELSAGGPLLEARMSGALAGLQETLGKIDAEQVFRLDGANTFEGAFTAVRRHLRKHRNPRSLVLSMNDPNALGALAAFRSEASIDRCAVAGQGATIDARNELRKKKTQLIGSVAYFPERYGEALLRLALDLLRRKATPTAIYTKHCLVTPRNVDKLYPAG